MVAGYFCTVYAVTGRRHGMVDAKAAQPQRGLKERSDGWGSFFASSSPPNRDMVDSCGAGGAEDQADEVHTSAHAEAGMRTSSMEELEMQQLRSAPVQGTQLAGALGQIDAAMQQL